MALNILDFNLGVNFVCRPPELDSWMVFFSARFAGFFPGGILVDSLTEPVQSRWQTSKLPEKKEQVSADLK